MSSTNTMQTRSMFLLYTDKNGSSTIREHFVHDGDTFFSSQLAQAKKEGGGVSIVSREDYEKQRSHKKTFG